MAEFEIYRREKKYHLYESVIKWIVDLVMVVCVSYIVTIYLFGKALVSGNSMSPGLVDGDGALLDKVSYCFDTPERFDVVLFNCETGNNKTYIRRIIGLPGETVQIKDGLIYIDGAVLDDSFLFETGDEDTPPEIEKIYNAGLASEPVVLGYDEYFVLGDNRNNSEDSRFSHVGNVSFSSIVGKLWFVTSPMGHMGFVK